MTPGEPVKLTDRYASVLCRSPKCKVDWRTRRGVVSWVNDRSVAIFWDGRKTLDIIPRQAVEKAVC
jgi:hypothetical protein